MDAKTYQETVLQPARSRGELPDELSRYGVSGTGDTIDGRAVEAAIKATRTIWAGLVNHSLYGGIVGRLMDEASVVEPQLRDEATRTRLGREIQSRRYKVLDEWINVRCKEAGGVMTAEALSRLVEQFASRGISKTEIDQRVRYLKVRVEALPRQPPGSVRSWRSPPDELRAIAQQRETITNSLAALGESSLGGFLGLSAKPSTQQIANQRIAKEEKWRGKRPDARKAAADRLLSILKINFQDTPGIYQLFAECENERTLRPFVEDAASDKTISVPEQEQLRRQARERGLDDAWIDRLIRQVAEERGAKVEPLPSSGTGPKPSPEAAPAEPRPAPTSQPAPKGRESVWERWRRWEHRNYWPLLLVLIAFKYITGPGADRHPTPSATEVAPKAVVSNPSTGAAPPAAPAAPSPAGSAAEASPPATTVPPPTVAPPIVEPMPATPAPVAPAPVAPSEPSDVVPPPVIPGDRGLAEEANLRGSRLNDRGQFARAAAAFEEAVHADPSYATAWANLSWAQYRVGRTDEAGASASQAIRLAGGDTQALTTALYAFGRVAEAAGQHDKARAAYARILGLDPSHKLARSAYDTLDLDLAPPAGLLAAANKVLRGQILEDEDVASMSDDELRIVRNAPYARHGKDFHEPGLNAFYYGSEARVAPRQTVDRTFTSAALTADDKANIQFFKALRASSERAALEGEQANDDPALSTSTTEAARAPVRRTTPPAARTSAPPQGQPWQDPFAE